MARTEVGSAYVSIYPDTSHFSDELANELGSSKTVAAMNSAGETASSGFSTGFSAVSVALGNIMATAATEIASIFMDNLNRGIERLDTIANFPKLMQTFGYSTDEAGAAIVAIQQHLDGLPGSTDEVLRLVQAISDSTGDLTLATTAGLAFNDMLTAAGADAYTSMMSMRMFDQMMGGAQFTSMRWQALVSKMPLQFNLLAQSMLGPTASAQDLGQAIADGEVTMTDVAEAMTELGPVFTEQARAMSYGIGTALRNYGNRLAAGIAKILEVLGQENIAKFIDKISYGIRDAMYAVAGAIEWLIVKIKVAKLDELFGQIAGAVKDAFASIDWEPVKQLFRDLIELARDVLQWIIDHGDIVKSVLVGIGTAIVAMGIVGVIEGIKNSLFGAGGLITALMANPFAAIVVAIGAVVAALVYFFTETEKGREIWAKFMDILGGVIDFLGGAIKVAVDGARVFLTALVQVVIDAVSFVWNALAGFVEGIIAGAQGFWDFLVELWDVGSQLLMIIAEFIMNLFAAAFNAIGSVIETFIGAWDYMWTFIDWVCDGILDVIAAVVGAAVQGAKDFIRDCKNTFNKIKNLLSNLKTNLSKTWGDIKTTISNVWNNIKKFFSNIWDSIKRIFTTESESAVSGTTAKFINFRDKLKGIWDAISGTVKKVWDTIKSIIEGIVKAITSLVKGDFEGMKTVVSTIFNGIKTIASNVWGGIKSAIKGIIDGIVAIASNAWSSMKTTASNVWNGIKTVASNVWGGIKSTIKTVTDGIKTTASNAWNSMKTTASNAWNGIKSSIKTVTDSIKTTASNAWNSVKTTASNVWGGIKTVAGNIWEGIKGKITAPIEAAKGVVEDAMSAMQGFINGLTGKTVTVNVNTSGAQSAVEDINKQIRNMTDKTLYVDVQKTGINGIDINSKAAGGGWYMSTYAAGGIATRATAGIFGEAGDEALVPLSNKSKVRPFARAVAYEINDGTTNSSVTITGNNFYIRNDNDIQRLAQELSTYQNRQMAGRL